MKIFVFVLILLSLYEKVSSSSSSVQRVVVPFSYGWRFHYGDDPSAPPQDGTRSRAFDLPQNTNKNITYKYIRSRRL